jgi:DNA-directed RNA polymerase subunit RPC12/RpoP
MIKTIVLTIFFALGYFQTRNSDQYVCLPCGLQCDSEIHTGPGKCPSCRMELVKKSSIKFKNIDLDEMCDRIRANPKIILLDVRSSDEFKGTSTDIPAVGHFKNAINISVQELNKKSG